MDDRRTQLGDMPRVPFKDSNGATINECRRKISDRRFKLRHSRYLM
jgi:hypothetical protein